MLALVVLAVTVPYTSADPPHQVASMDSAVRALPAGTKVLDDWDQGGYLMWRYPHLDLMMHGYGDTFTTAELRRNTTLIRADTGWDSDLRASGARVALLRPSSLLAYQLTTLEGWHVVRQSDALELLRAPSTWVSEGPAVSPGFSSVG